MQITLLVVIQSQHIKIIYTNSIKEPRSKFGAIKFEALHIRSPTDRCQDVTDRRI